VTKYEHGRNRKVRHTPLIHENELAMRRKQRPTSPRKEVGGARAEELGD
jgi:hypothetical protein